MTENYFDKASRHLAALDPPAFLGWLLGLPPDAFTFHGWVDTRGIPFPGEPDRVGDTVAHVADVARHGVPWAVAVEFQTKPDPEMFGRMLGYLSSLWLNRKPDAGRGSRFHLGAAVVNLTGSGSASRDMSWPAAGLHTQLHVVERNLEHEPAENPLAGIEAGRWSRVLLPWLPLLAGGDDTDLIDRWKVAAGAEPDRHRRGQFGAIANLFARRVGRDTIWKEKLEGWNVEESTYVNEWIAVGEKRGEARGEARGKEVGSMQEAQAAILRLGGKKFGPPPEDIVAAIKAVQDRARLERMLDHIFDATSWDEMAATA